MFRDAIAITRGLGYRYLWIDSLCILQDSPEDWKRESANMGYIYKNSVPTITAEEDPDSHAGISNISNMSRESSLDGQTMVQTSCHSSKTRLKGKVFCGRHTKDANVSRGPLSQRVWTLTLSPRVLRFAQGQVWWPCRETQQKERIPLGSDHFSTNAWDSDPSSRIVANRPYRQRPLKPFWSWYRIVNGVTARSISFSKDKTLLFLALRGKLRERMGKSTRPVCG